MTTITALTDLSKLPNQSQDQAVFDANFAYLVENLPLRAQQENALAANLNSIAAGGAYAISYTFMPYNNIGGGLGYLTFTNGAASQSAATSVFTDLRDARLASITALLSSFVGSSSQTKGHLRIVKVGDPSKYLVFSFTAASQNGYTQTHVGACVDSSSANPFTYGDSLLVYFQRTGDKGDKGDNGTSLTPMIHVREESAAGAGPATTVSQNTWVKRAFNTVRTNSVTGASLANNQITLPAGTYEYEGNAAGTGCAQHQARLINVTDNIVASELGTTEYTDSSITTRSVVTGRFVLASAKVFELQHRASSVSGSFGSSVSNFGNANVHSEIKFTKIA